ncbi:hypothetical protein G8770_23175 [Aestuariicella hydrocarbonica]|uniref:Uncharacterized protein n=1 Tax=Pseudomaricurvus hydrocarbonicus TaxID=1470433 RepID=A0A9E5MQ91_9GAMM|nr:hypothetical protein [Aestuariicella hydrocarbonica]NHO68466.1 hypothetical protein [Aestuariicella hydrocarbonica]
MPINAPLILNNRLDDYTLYRLVHRAENSSVYVGVVRSKYYDRRFFRHCADDLDAPWHMHQFPSGTYQQPEENWPYYSAVIEKVFDFTRFEAAAAQQYWWEKYGGVKGSLKFAKQPLSRTQFILLRGKGCWDGYVKGFPNGWAPVR